VGDVETVQAAGEIEMRGEFQYELRSNWDGLLTLKVRAQVVTAGKLVEISTSPQGLLLLLV
jgi:hypothetical protein